MNKEVQLLEFARARIERQGNRFLCVTIFQISAELKDYRRACFNIRLHIQRSLGEYRTLEQWLIAEAKIPFKQLTPKNMKAYRLRYIDHLIKEFQ